MSLIATVDSGAKVGKRRERNPHDWYVEPAWSVEGLLDVQAFDAPIWDPCCGTGTIPTVFARHGVKAFASDLVDRGFKGAKRFNFLNDGALQRIGFGWKSICFNPPYQLAEPFLRRALYLATDRVCMLNRLTWLEGARRRWVFDETPLAAIHPFAHRVSMPPGGLNIKAEGGAVAFAWFVFQHGWKGPPIMCRIERGPK